jgi:hypothetical protein
MWVQDGRRFAERMKLHRNSPNCFHDRVFETAIEIPIVRGPARNLA